MTGVIQWLGSGMVEMGPTPLFQPKYHLKARAMVLMSDEGKEKVVFISSDGDRFEISVEVARLAVMASNLLEDEHEEEIIEIPIGNVKTFILKKVIEFCEHYVTEPMSEIEKPLKSDNMAEVVQKFYADFVNIDQETLFDLILAANFMDIKPLLDLTCATVASMIKGKTTEEIRTTFNIKNDFTREEEEQVREENRWCEEA